MTIVRPANPADAPAIARIHVETGRATYAGLLPERMLAHMRTDGHRESWLGVLSGQRGRQTVLVAERSRQGAIGFISAGRARAPLAGYEAEIYTIYVSPDHQDQGIGTELLSACFQRLDQQHLHGVMLWVLAKNPSRFFYEAMGGSMIAHRKERLWGVVLPEFAYGWPDLTRALNRSSDGARAD
jgi:ribosomal protein S18 acetylase RimI-like enzyme